MGNGLYDIGFKYTKDIKSKIEGNESGEYCRSHIFPAWALQEIIAENPVLSEKKVKKPDQFEIAKKSLHTDAGICDLFHQLRTSAQSKHAKNKSAASDAIPYIILPKYVEEEINKEISSYAEYASDTKVESAKTKGTSAIVNDSQFAKQHPDVYLQIFSQVVSQYSETLPSQDRKKLQTNLRSGIDLVHKLSDQYKGVLDNIIEDDKRKKEILDTPSLFGISSKNRSRTKSEERLVPDDPGTPRHEKYEAFAKENSEKSFLERIMEREAKQKIYQNINL